MQKKLDQHRGWARFCFALLHLKNCCRHCRNDAFERVGRCTSRESSRIASISTSLATSFILHRIHSRNDNVDQDMTRHRHCRNDTFERGGRCTSVESPTNSIHIHFAGAILHPPSHPQQKRRRGTPHPVSIFPDPHRSGQEAHTCDRTFSQPKMTQTYRRRHSRGTQAKHVLTTDIVVSRLVSSSHVGQRTARTMITRGVAGSSWANCLCLLPYVCSGKKTD